MTVEIKKVYEVWTTEDDRGRRGRMVGVFTEKQVAVNSARGKGWYGGDAEVAEGHAVQLDGKWYRLASPEEVELNTDLIAEEERIKREALAKLSPRERRLLKVQE